MKRMTIAMFALAALPAVAVAQDSTARRDTTSRGDTTSQGGQRQVAPQTPADTNRSMQAQTPAATKEAPAGQGAGQAAQPGAENRATAQGRRTSGRGMNLTRDQIIQLQTALTNAGCDAGTADGVMGPRTRRAITCARKKNNVSSNEELYRSLNLDFSTGGGGATSDAGGAAATPSSVNSQGASADANAASATRGDSAQVGGTNRGRIYPPADSVRKATTNANPSAHPAGHDSTMRNQAPPSRP